MGFWLCVGFAAHTAGAVGSSVLGSAHAVLATIAFVIGVIGMVLALILMIDACADLLPPTGLAARPRAVVIGATIGPFVGVYALWGLVEEQVRDIYFVNIALHGSGGGDDWSVDLRRIRFYLILAVVCWVLRQLSVLSASGFRIGAAGPAIG